MKPRVLIVVSADPRVSHRAAEAIRIAAGVGTWGKVELNVYLEGPAVLLLKESGELPDEADLGRHWELLRASGHKIYVQSNNPLLAGAEGARTFLSAFGTVPAVEPISKQQLAQLTAESSYLLHF